MTKLRRRGKYVFKYILLSMVAVGVLAASSGLFTLARFGDTASVGANAFTSGTVDISTSPATALITTSAMAPATKITGTLTVTNAGTLQLRYFIQVAATNADGKNLRGNINLRIGLRGGGDFLYHNYNGTTTTLTDDTQLYAGTGIAPGLWTSLGAPRRAPRQATGP